MRRLPSPAFTLLLLGILGVSVVGCNKKRIKASPMPAPIVVARHVEDVPPPVIDAKLEPQLPPELMIPLTTPPPRPRLRNPAQPATPETEPEATENKPAAPRMAPRLSPSEADQYKEKTWQAINTAERNLESASGRSHTATQRDLEGKVQGFLAQAYEAIAVGDWVRAYNLAEKALVLSRELVNSL